MQPTEWTSTTMGDLCEAIYDGPHATPKKIDIGPIFLGISNLSNGRLNLSDTNHLSEEDYVKWTRRVTPTIDDIVFSYETRLGEAALIPEGLRCCLGRRMGLLRPNLGKVHPRFLLYAYLGPEFQSTIRARTVHGSTVNRILLTELPDYPIRVPPLAEQKAIAHILGTLDDKIELNRQMNGTLEEIARALFKSWFVDFDPVHAKARCAQPAGMDAATAALFPSEFEDSALGPIPSGWRVDDIDIMAKVTSGKRPNERSSESTSDLQVPLYGGAGPMGFVSEPLHEGNMLITGRVGTLGKVFRSTFPVWPSDNTLLVIPKTSECFEFLYIAMCRMDLANLNRGSTQPLLTQSDLKNQMIPSPPTKVVQRFHNLVKAMFKRIDQNRVENETLAELRDTLLPKLMSGELRVPEVKDVIEEVTQ